MMSRLWDQIVQSVSGSLLRRQELTSKARTGREGEEAAYWHLRRQGMVMVARNYRPATGRGEIDLIGWEGETLVFIEVKTRSASALRAPEAAVDRDQQGRLKSVAANFRRWARCTTSPRRFDVVTVEPGDGGSKIQHYHDAFR